MNEKKSVRDLSDLHRLFPDSRPSTQEPVAGKSAAADLLGTIVNLSVHFEKSGRKGGGVTIIRGFHHTRDDLLLLAKELKTLCGAGGAVKNEEIEIQGDHRERIYRILKDKGFRVKGRR